MAMVNVVTIAASLGGSVAEADWLGPKGDISPLLSPFAEMPHFVL